MSTEKQQTPNEGFADYIENVCGRPSEENRMYGHHCRTFRAGAKWKEEQDNATIQQLSKALLNATERMERARGILHRDGQANWGMLDSSDLKEVIEIAKEATKIPS
jgi:hypothetical protein